MPRHALLSLLVTCPLALPLAGCMSKDESSTGGDPMMKDGRAMSDQKMRADAMSAEQMTSGWPDSSRKAAKAMTEKYGKPDGVTPNMLVWNEKGPWKQIVISRQEVTHEFPMKHPDVLEQVIDYRVPPDMVDELAMYDGSVVVERTKGTMSARCDKEEANFLALNLAHDIITDKRTVEEARRFYADAVAASMRGEKPPYMQKLQFQPARGSAGDPDKPAMER